MCLVVINFCFKEPILTYCNESWRVSKHKQRPCCHRNMVFQKYQSFDSFWISPHHESPPRSQSHVKYRHRKASAIQICPGQTISITSRFYPLLPLLFTLLFSKVLWVPHVPDWPERFHFKTTEGRLFFFILNTYTNHFQSPS